MTFLQYSHYVQQVDLNYYQTQKNTLKIFGTNILAYLSISAFPQQIPQDIDANCSTTMVVINLSDLFSLVVINVSDLFSQTHSY